MTANRLTGIGLILLGIGAASVAILGPLALGAIDWRVSSNAENQVLGGDIATLLLAAPLAFVAGILWLRGHRLAPVLAIGPAVYGLYMFSSVIFGVGYNQYDGNNEAFYPLLLVLVILSWVLAAIAWSRISSSELPSITVPMRRALAWTMILVGALFVVAWSGQIAQVIVDPGSLTEYESDPATFWTIKTLDLAFVMPMAIATGIGLLRQHPLAARASYALVGFLTLMSAGVSAMGIVMLVKDDPSATIVFPIVTIVVLVLFAVLTVRLYRAYASQSVNENDLRGTTRDARRPINATRVPRTWSH